MSQNKVLRCAGWRRCTQGVGTALQRSGRKCFDSADFALQQQGKLGTIVSGDLAAPEQPIETLAPKLSPTAPPPRRMSNLGDGD